MTALIVSAAGLFLLLFIALLLSRRKRPSARTPSPPSTARPAQPAAAPAAPSAPRPAPARTLLSPPSALASFQRLGRDQLSTQRQAAITAALQRVAQPSRALHQLVSPDFLAQASSADLAELLQGEPQVTAKVLATVNSPLYALQAPVVSLGPAITYLGLNTVRGLCLHYMLEDSFQSGDSGLRRYFDQVWGASSLASELCLRLAQGCHLTDPGALATQVVLSFLGRLSLASVLPTDKLLAMAPLDLLERTRLEQQQVGLGACEVGCLLMQAWQLPKALIDETGAIDALLCPQPPALSPRAEARLAVAYLSARIGEQMMFGELAEPAALDWADEARVDLFPVRQALSLPALAPLPELLQGQELNRHLRQMQQALQPRG